MNPTHLTTEYRIDPEGIDAISPRLSWQVQSDQRNRLQTAYQVLVADSEAALAADQGTLWDSGKTSSPSSLHIAYSGTPLTSRMRCWWKVRVWDNEDAPSAWSETARFSMGLLEKEDWQAQWIGYGAPEGVDFESAGAPPMD
ncbi:MAG TPA: alpha-L-rhamnosidase, partial [Candidatus Hydrogenedentes bacterium]|nr:alpha-L-rhamnosidase [Candidatus Hydrogenedentota bacterium]